MFDSLQMTTFFLTLAQTAPGGSAAPGGSPLSIVFPILFMFALVYFIILRPQRREEKERQAKIAAIQRGDKVVTIGGIHGSVEAINQADATITVTVGPKMSLTFDKSAVRTVVSKNRDKGDKEKPGKDEAAG